MNCTAASESRADDRAGVHQNDSEPMLIELEEELELARLADDGGPA